MKKIFVCLTICMLFISCSNLEKMKINNKIENKILEKDISNLKAEIGIEKIKLTWDIDDINDVENIEILLKQSNSRKYKSIKILEKNKKELEVFLPSFLKFDLKIRLNGKNGLNSNGVVLEQIITKMEKVVLDEFEGREMQIYLPEEYGTSNKRYPVVYMHDGQNLFNKRTSSDGEWMIDETLNKLINKNEIEECIVVGIYNSGERTNEYVPYKIEENIGGQNGGEADKYSEFIVKKLIPYIDSKYMTIPNRENRAVMGSSFGGILALWMGMNYSDTFSMIGAFSPSLWVKDGYFLKELSEMEKKDMKIWIDLGSEEFDLGLCRKAVDILIKQGYKYGEDLIYYEDNQAMHNEKAWALRVRYPMLMFKGKKTNRKFIDYILELEICKIDYLKNRDRFIIVNPTAYFDDGMRYTIYEDINFIANGDAFIEENIDIILEDNSFKKIFIKGNINKKGLNKSEVIANYKGIEKKIIIE